MPGLHGEPSARPPNVVVCANYDDGVGIALAELACDAQEVARIDAHNHHVGLVDSCTLAPVGIASTKMKTWDGHHATAASIQS